MSVIARFSIPAEEFAFGDVLEIREGIQVRLESMIPTGTSTIPYLWVSSDDADAVQTALQDSPLVDNVRLVDETGTETLVRVEWSTEVDGLVDVIEGSEAVILEAEGRGDNWSFRLRFPDRQHLSEFYRACLDEGVTLDLDEVNNPIGSAGGIEYDITETQREALLTALEAGYFDVPRKINLQDLAEQFGISDTALSQRLRRGLTGLLSSTLPQQSPGDRSDDQTDD